MIKTIPGHKRSRYKDDVPPLLHFNQRNPPHDNLSPDVAAKRPIDRYVILTRLMWERYLRIQTFLSLPTIS